MENIVLIGSSGHAKVIIDIVRRAGRYAIAGLLDEHREVGEQTLGCQVIGRENQLPTLVKAHGLTGVVIAVGDNDVRAAIASRVQAQCPGLPLMSAIHPRATVAEDVEIGEGTVVMAGVTVNPGASIGRGCILNTQASLDHDSVMEDFASLAPRVATGGHCRIGVGVAVGIGAVLGHGVHVGAHTVIGASSLVLQSIGAGVVAYGSPARVVRGRTPGTPYL